MATHDRNDPRAEAEVRQAVEAWTAALARKDSEGLVRDYADDAVVYDVGCQLTGREPLRELWEACLPYFGDTIGTERKDVTVHVEGNLAVIHCLSRLRGMKATGPVAETWLRTTVCYRKIDGQWKCVHDHVSLPVDCGAEKPTYILDENPLGKAG